MPKGRHGARNKKATSTIPNDPQQLPVASLPSFSTLEEKTPTLLTLLFDTKTAQHAALSRIEAFYESVDDSQAYLTLEQAQQQRQCQYYEAFNFPIDAVRQWLSGMKQFHCPEGKPRVDDGGDNKDEDLIDHWWRPYCNDHECHFLAHLAVLGVLDNDEKSGDPSNISTKPVYLISALSSNAASLRHERLHFLFFISSTYRDQVKEEYRNLTKNSLRIIERDLSMRKYSSKVWIDEFQAFISEDAGEFGNVVKEECQEIGINLRRYQALLMRELNMAT